MFDWPVKGRYGMAACFPAGSGNRLRLIIAFGSCTNPASIALLSLLDPSIQDTANVIHCLEAFAIISPKSSSCPSIQNLKTAAQDSLEDKESKKLRSARVSIVV